MSRRILLSLAAFCCLATSVLAEPTIIVGPGGVNVPYQLLFNTPNQLITILVSGGDQVPGLNLNMEVGGNTSGPIITAADVIGSTGATIFQPNHNPQGSPPSNAVPGRRISVGATTASGTVSAAGTLARITVSTVGIPSGTYAFLLNGIQDIGDTDFTIDEDFETITAAITNGSFFVLAAPEPASLVMGLFAVAALGAVVIRRRRS